MAIEWMVEVWKNSKIQKSSQLLTFLAIADIANDFGIAWPGLNKISEKTRQTPRNTSRIIGELEKTGELYVHRKKGKVNYYFIYINRDKEESIAVLQKWFKLSPEVAEQTILDLDMLLEARPTQDNLSIDKLSPVTRVSSTQDKALSSDPLLSFKDIYNSGDAEQEFGDIRSSANYRDLQNEIIAACKKLNALALKEEDVKNIDILHEAKVKPAEIREFYSKNGQTSWWYRQFWKGKKGQFPTTQDIIDTIEQARSFSGENGAEIALQEVQEWILGNRKFGEFSSPVTVEVVREMGEYDLKSKNPAFWAVRFKETFAEHNSDN